MTAPLSCGYVAKAPEAPKAFPKLLYIAVAGVGRLRRRPPGWDKVGGGRRSRSRRAASGTPRLEWANYLNHLAESA